MSYSVTLFIWLKGFCCTVESGAGKPQRSAGADDVD